MAALLLPEIYFQYTFNLVNSTGRYTCHPQETFDAGSFPHTPCAARSAVYTIQNIGMAVIGHVLIILPPIPLEKYARINLCNNRTVNMAYGGAYSGCGRLIRTQLHTNDFLILRLLHHPYLERSSHTVQNLSHCLHPWY